MSSESTNDGAVREKRSILLVDREYQIEELSHGVNQFMAMLFVEMLLFAAIAYLLRTGSLNEGDAVIAAIAVAFAVPVALSVLYSVTIIRRTHRVAGAAYRLAVDVRNILSNPSFRFHLRTGDYLQTLADELNDIMEQVEARHQAVDDATDALSRVREGIGPLCDGLKSEEAEALREHLGRIDAALQTARFGTGQRPPTGEQATRN